MTSGQPLVLKPIPTQDTLANILGVGVHTVNMPEAVGRIRKALAEDRKGYVYLAGAHGIMEAHRHRDLRAIIANAFLVVPDGMPIVWIGRQQGFSNMDRVFGPDLMLEVIGHQEFSSCRHFLCGGAPGVAEQLRDEMMRRFPWAVFAGVYAPPFRPMTQEEEFDFATLVRQARPDIIWVGLGTPKQDRFMAKYLPLLDTKLMIGVGAAFLFHTGAIQDSPQWVKRAGLQWLHRLLQEPSRLWRRYLINVPWFLLEAILQIAGLKSHTVTRPSDSTTADLE